MFLSLYIGLYMLTVFIFLLIINHLVDKMKDYEAKCPIVKTYKKKYRGRRKDRKILK